MQCYVDGCDSPVWSSGLCNKHRQRMAKYGSPDVVFKPHGIKGKMSDEERKKRNSASCARRYRKSREAVLAKAAAYRQANREALRVKGRDLYIANPRLFKDLARARRARIRGAFVEVVKLAVVYERDRGVCGICGAPVSIDTAHLDHIFPISKGGKHCYSNVQLAHPSCNRAKSDKLPGEAYASRASRIQPAL